MLKHTHPTLSALLRLIRMDRPIGTWLLLWPALWALWTASRGWPEPRLLVIFILGAFLMRSAGCAINDFADRHLDGHVHRTQDRPLVMGQLSPSVALVTAATLSILAFVLVLFTNALTIALSFVAVLLAAVYPFMKRYMPLPQAVLGAAFAWSIPMAYAAVTSHITQTDLWLMYGSVLLWTLAYDTQYAMADRSDDVKIGIQSSAILWGQADIWIIASLQLLALMGLLLIGQRLQLNVMFSLSLLMAGCFFGYQFWLTKNRQPQQCLRAFKNNHWVGASIFMGLLLNYIG